MNRRTAKLCAALAAITVVLGVIVVVVWAQGPKPASAPPVSQAGLPPELFIPDKPSIADQRKVLESLINAAAPKGKAPGGGILGGLLGGIKRFLSGKAGATALDVPTMLRKAQKIRQADMQIEVHGVLKDVDGKLSFAGEGGGCPIQMAGGVSPEDFPKGSLNGLPAVAKGTVEMPFNRPVIHALSLKPSLPLAQLRLGRIYDQLGNQEEAITAYVKASRELLGSGLTSWGAFAATRAGWIAYDMRQIHRANSYLYGAWSSYVQAASGKTAAIETWVPMENGAGWRKISAPQAIGPRLDVVARQGRWGFFYRLVSFFVTIAGHNAGLGMLLLAFLTRLCLHPLTVKQLGSARAMQKLQPQIKALQDEFKDDKQKFQQEMWRVWQENGVNPLGGCWPMLIQMPILWAVYEGIEGYVWQFSHSSFFWVKSLAMPDLPLLIAYAVSMIFQMQITNKLQPVTDPKQRQQQQMMTWMMPLMFFFFFKNLASGFILYWLASNLFYVAESGLYRYQMDRKEAAGGPPVAVKPKRRSRFMDALISSMEKAQQAQAPKPTDDVAPPPEEELKPKPSTNQPKSGSRKRKK